MNCKEVRKWMSPYLDSELGATKTFEISEHLRNCPKCKARFERERGVDDMLRGRLERDQMPPELWSRINRAVSLPPWLRVLTSPRGLAVAACLAVMVLGAIGFWPREAVNEDPWVVRELALLAPDDNPFGESTTVESPEQLLLDTLGVELASAAGSAYPHPLKLVDATTRTDPDGREYLEVRLNCCGKPVLMVLARPGEGPLPMPFEGASVGPTGDRRIDGINVAARDIDGVLAVVASRHPVKQIAKRLQIRKA